MQTTKTKILLSLNTDKCDVAIRALSAIFAGYLVAATLSALLAMVLPLSPVDSTLTAMMLSFSAYAGAGIWAFSVKNQWRALTDLLCLSGLFYLLILIIG
ncbi:hypothetical protein AB4298_18475 [Shewanella sp. 10N.261.52.F9]|uniref:hypothetical protein n=1 Tax=Shewanella TaxID=22 RepID=UPI00200EB025|nr:hypothetical protein [Shewanella marinintestina]MCL1145420.1 hypothetical protein [Shewanella marinintestina]